MGLVGVPKDTELVRADLSGLVQFGGKRHVSGAAGGHDRLASLAAGGSGGVFHKRRGRRVPVLGVGDALIDGGQAALGLGFESIDRSAQGHIPGGEVIGPNQVQHFCRRHFGGFVEEQSDGCIEHMFVSNQPSETDSEADEAIRRPGCASRGHQEPTGGRRYPKPQRINGGSGESFAGEILHPGGSCNTLPGSASAGDSKKYS